MLRLIDEHKIRPVKSFDGYWDFAIADEAVSKAGLPENYSRRIWVPAAWECLPGLENYRGKAWFRREFELENMANVRLVFGGVSHTAEAYIDGLFVGCHYDAFTPWEVVLADVPAGDHEIVVEVDNSFGDHSALHIENDYYTWGGITRPVELQILDEVFIERIMLTPRREGEFWNLNVSISLKNIGRNDSARSAIFRFEQKELEFKNISIASGKTATVNGILHGLKVQEWTASSPSLYYACAELYDGQKVSDDIFDRFGFREICVSGRDILLNGKSLRLRGDATGMNIIRISVAHYRSK